MECAPYSGGDSLYFTLKTEKYHMVVEVINSNIVYRLSKRDLAEGFTVEN